MASLSLPDTGTITDTYPEPCLYLPIPGVKIPELSVAENLRYQTLLRWGESPTPALLKDTLNYWGISALADQPLGNLSQGQQQRVSLSLLLLGPGQLWLLDEPTTALDAGGTQTFWALCRQHQAQGGSLVIATHHEPEYSMQNIRRIQLGLVQPSTII